MMPLLTRLAAICLGMALFLSPLSASADFLPGSRWTDTIVEDYTKGHYGDLLARLEKAFEDQRTAIEGSDWYQTLIRQNEELASAAGQQRLQAISRACALYKEEIDSLRSDRNNALALLAKDHADTLLAGVIGDLAAYSDVLPDEALEPTSLFEGFRRQFGLVQAKAYYFRSLLTPFAIAVGDFSEQTALEKPSKEERERYLFVIGLYMYQQMLDATGDATEAREQLLDDLDRYVAAAADRHNEQCLNAVGTAAHTSPDSLEQKVAAIMAEYRHKKEALTQHFKEQLMGL